MFHCHEHSGSGGETLLIDAINAAEKLKENNPSAFEFLAKTHIPAKYYVNEILQYLFFLGSVFNVYLVYV